MDYFIIMGFTKCHMSECHIVECALWYASLVTSSTNPTIRLWLLKHYILSYLSQWYLYVREMSLTFSTVHFEDGILKCNFIRLHSIHALHLCYDMTMCEKWNFTLFRGNTFLSHTKRLTKINDAFNSAICAVACCIRKHLSAKKNDIQNDHNFS